MDSGCSAFAAGRWQSAGRNNQDNSLDQLVSHSGLAPVARQALFDKIGETIDRCGCSFCISYLTAPVPASLAESGAFRTHMEP